MQIKYEKNLKALMGLSLFLLASCVINPDKVSDCMGKNAKSDACLALLGGLRVDGGVNITLNNVGAPCTYSSDCDYEDGRCLRSVNSGALNPGGYCSVDYTTCEGAMCGVGATCLYAPDPDDYVSASDQRRPQCLQTCNSVNDCRPGFICSRATGVGVCFWFCSSDSDCRTGERCYDLDERPRQACDPSESRGCSCQ